jgi:MSHA biogenesis protein MshL
MDRLRLRGCHPGVRAAASIALSVFLGLASARAQQPAARGPLPQPLAVSRLSDPQSQAGVAAPVPSRVEAPSPVGQQAPAPAGQRPLAPLPVTRLEERLREEFLDAGRTFSLRLTEPVPVKELLLLLVRDTRFSIVAAPDVAGSFVGELKDVTLKQALDLVLHPLDLDYAVDDTFIRVFARRTETRRFDVNYVLTSRATRRTLGAPDDQSGAVDLPGGATAHVTALDHGDVFEALEAGVKTLLSPNGRFNLDRKAALLQVTDYPDRLDEVRLYVEAVEQRVTRQVEIQAWVIEVELDAAFANGLDWSAIAGAADGRVRVTPATIKTLLSALDAQGTVNVLASPRVVAMNNEPAVMRVGRQNVYFLTSSQIDAASGRPVQTSAVPRALTEGLVLSVTPQISADGIVQMSITPSVTERDGEATSRFGDTVPVLTVREADTFVRVREGETVVMSGLMRQRHGARTDLLILLTPTVVTPGGVAASGVER